ncbi:hydantoinase/oxoprolinase family protein [Aureimonas populi]|uniref:Hydantoinase/oxoprolinase family protein n=1 Tax=Aureimonas populi TaxID=1701758 RepID=A0ABW5CRJ3_9HYPH|nr:hydantoinase/oxoprolinase family protein [Aureimonas populi]
MPSADMSLAVAVDIGGTFTDVALLDQNSGRTWRAKTPSVPSDPSIAFMNGIRLALEEAGAAPRALERVLHGTTVATNMILEGKGARTALVTTRGFRHVLAIGRQDIPRNENLYTWVKPARPVPASRILEVDERIGAGGIVLSPLDEASVRAAGEALGAMDVQAVAVCLMHSFAEPAHELRCAEILREMLPGVAVTASVEVQPVVREYERSLTTVLNASVMPGVTTYVERLQERLREEGVEAPLLLMQSNGGVASAGTILHAPAFTALSGPAAGVVGARAVAAACGIRDIITVDIGGTSADICLIRDGRIGLTQTGRIGEWPVSLPMVDMVTIGAGGGSIARVSGTTLTVGPESAGARPGPAAYGHGGTEATVTDAHVVLGHLPKRLLGGRMKLDRDASFAAIEREVAGALGLDPIAAARGILAIADNHMVGAMRVISVERGHDPRDFTLVPFGGSGPLHGCALASLLGIRRIMIPPAPGVLCADGLLSADLRVEFSRTLPKAGPLAEMDTDALVAELSDQASAWLEVEEVEPARRLVGIVALLRYRGQGGEIAVAWAGDGEGTEANFRQAHRQLYGFELRVPIELVTLRVEAVGLAHRPDALALAEGPPALPYDTVPVRFDGGEAQVPVVNRTDLGAGARLTGPMIVTQLDTTTVIMPGWEGEVHPSGALLLTDKGGQE